MAADGSIGGFSGQWGQGCKIDKKRALLQSEGVQFDDKTGKIVKDCMLTSIIPADIDDDKSDDNRSDAKTTGARPSKRQKTEKNTSGNKKTSKYFATKAKVEDDRQEATSADTTSTSTSSIDTELREVTLQMIDERAAGKTC